MKKKQTKWTVLEMFLTGPGTRKEVWERNPEAIPWETFKRVTSGLRADGLLETTDDTRVRHYGACTIISPYKQSQVRLTTKGRRSVEGWRIVRERGEA